MSTRLVAVATLVALTLTILFAVRMLPTDVELPVAWLP